MMNMTDTVKQLVILNVLFFIGSHLVPNSHAILALHYFESDLFQPWQLITHIFMHGDLMHIFFNMFALISFGSALEHFWGSKKFLFFYFTCGLGAALIQSAVYYFQIHYALSSSEGLIAAAGIYQSSMVGASGAIYGLLVAFAFMFPDAELGLMFIPVPIKAKFFVPVIVLLDLFSGVTGYSIFGGGIAHFAHVGGAVFGFLMMWYWKKNQFNKNRWDR